MALATEQLAAAHPGPDISAPAAASLAGLPPPQARAALRELAGVSLITERVPDRFTLHDLLREYAAERARAGENSAEGRAALHQMLDHYLHSAAAAARVLDPVPDLPDLGRPQDGVTPERVTDSQHALEWFGAEHKVLLAVMAPAAREGFGDHVRQLPWTLVAFLDRGGHWQDLLISQLAALACAERSGDVAGQARTHRNLGRAELKLGQTARAHAHLTSGTVTPRSPRRGLAPVAELHLRLRALITIRTRAGTVELTRTWPPSLQR